MAALLSLGHSLREVADAAASMTPVPGRMQVIDGGSRYPRVIVDYAHTPDALEKTLAALRPQCRGDLICLVGCGGDRDRGKRGQMGLAAAKGSDRVWFTSDNPRSEDPLKIIYDMLEPLKKTPMLSESIVKLTAPRLSLKLLIALQRTTSC